MNTKVFKQYDSRWGNLPYPTSKSPVSSDGCGLCAVAHCIREIQQFKKFTPKEVHPWMKQFAVAGQGTRYANPDGIAESLERYGLMDVKKFGNMDDFWKEVAKGDRVGVILFWSGYAPDGTLWTTGGHFVAFNSYKYENGKHWLYTLDSGFRNNDGWHAYETSMKGRIGYLWTARIPKEGWKKEGRYWYFYVDDEVVKNVWKQTDKKWYWLGEDGKMATSQWLKYKDEWYYLDSKGVMLTNGWAKDSKKKWFYLGSDGKMVKSKWVKWKDEWYYLKSNGEMASEEWAQDKAKKWFYLGTGGKMKKSAWIKYKDQWYYVGANGAMVTGKQTIDGKEYNFDQSGKLIN